MLKLQVSDVLQAHSAEETDADGEMGVLDGVGVPAIAFNLRAMLVFSLLKSK
ncbi:hypothetical protein NN484_21635 [Pseudomonas serboccidentalis]|uniref:Uncharacterized protein n=1 Tax=Pseudomonas serboccidentalis TaxID=2964670 RepID=A0ABY7Z5Z3_9PSED|nr:hypothetical protein [Pseudomonas serboccidentalis]WDR35086.1 hypothetical protein NN484_21635 [Pseudomonas serboccidentalis]